MRKIKKGDIVGRISYGKDIFFIVEDIINLNKKETLLSFFWWLTGESNPGHLD